MKKRLPLARRFHNAPLRFLLADLRPEPDGWAVTFFAAGPVRLTVEELAELNRRVSQFVAEEPHPTASS